MSQNSSPLLFSVSLPVTLPLLRLFMEQGYNHLVLVNSSMNDSFEKDEQNKNKNQRNPKGKIFSSNNDLIQNSVGFRNNHSSSFQNKEENKFLSAEDAKKRLLFWKRTTHLRSK